MARTLSLISWICRSISGTCSLTAIVLKFTSGILELRHSNYRSMSAVSTLKPGFLYVPNTFLRDLTRTDCSHQGTYSAVVNFTFLERLATNGSPSTNIMSIPSVIFLTS
jgi:hypothetical protein